MKNKKETEKEKAGSGTFQKVPKTGKNRLETSQKVPKPGSAVTLNGPAHSVAPSHLPYAKRRLLAAASVQQEFPAGTASRLGRHRQLGNLGAGWACTAPTGLSAHWPDYSFFCYVFINLATDLHLFDYQMTFVKYATGLNKYQALSSTAAKSLEFV